MCGTIYVRDTFGIHDLPFKNIILLSPPRFSIVVINVSIADAKRGESGRRLTISPSLASIWIGIPLLACIRMVAHI